jgi:hypothetical protein
MDESGALYQEFLQYQITQATFQLEARVLCGLLSREDANKQLEDFRAEVSRKQNEIIASRRKKAWWSRLTHTGLRALWGRGE